MQLPEGMTPETLSYEFSGYGYRPILAAPIVFTVVFAILTLIHFWYNVRSKQWWMVVFTIACALETAGHALRIYGHFQPFVTNAYIAMQCILVITPAFIAAVSFRISILASGTLDRSLLTPICFIKQIDFAILGKVATLFPPKYSLVSPRWIIPFFVVLDVSSLAVQGGGSGVAAIAQIDGRDTTSGGNIVVVGLAIQLFGYLTFDVLFLRFCYSVSRDPPKGAELWNQRTITFLKATSVSSMLIFIRSLYRTIEMAVGWTGVIAHAEWSFYVFDATMVALAAIVFVLYDPASYLPRHIKAPASSEYDHEGPESPSPSSSSTSEKMA